MTKTSQEEMIVPMLTVLAMPRYNFMGTEEMLPTLKKIMKLNSEDKKSFRGTQTKFDKTFYNLIQKRDTKFSFNESMLIEFTRRANGQFILSITPSGRRFLKQRR